MTPLEKLTEYLNNLTPEQKEELRKEFSDKNPKGWISIEDSLPMMKAVDIMQGYTIYEVRDKDGNEFYSGVSDHNTWYYYAKDVGITHWYNN